MLAQRSLMRTLLVALVVWIAGVVGIRLGGNSILVDGPGFIIGYVIMALLGPPTVWIAARLIGFDLKSMMVPTLVIAMTALVLDGFVMGFFPQIYTSPDKIKYLAPMFLWTFGWACISAFVMGGGKLNHSQDC